MTVYVDEALFPYRGRLYCHLMSDRSDADLGGLHSFAALLGLKREWFQDKPGFPHYDLAPSKRAKALRLGAIAVDSQELLRLCKRGM